MKYSDLLPWQQKFVELLEQCKNNKMNIPRIYLPRRAGRTYLAQWIRENRPELLDESRGIIS